MAKGRVSIIVERCKACGFCVEFFPTKVLALSSAFNAKGFNFSEVISPYPTLYHRRNRLGDGLDTMKYYKEKSKVRHGAPTSEVGLTMTGEIIGGKFADRDRPDYQSLLRAQRVESLGDRYVAPSETLCSCS